MPKRFIRTIIVDLFARLEILEVTGKTKDEHEEDAGHAPLYDHLLVGLQMDRDVLYERINRRVELMMEKGLLEEAQAVVG